MTTLNRRELLQMGAAAVVSTLAKPATAQNVPPPLKKVKIDAYSRTLHWLRKPEEVAEACHQIGNTTIDLTVRANPGHVQPDKVKTDLPVFVKGLEKEGITVTSMAADINDAATPYCEDMLGTASQLGIRTHWWRGFGGFDNTKPYGPQIEAFKPRLAALVKLDEKHGMKAMYHPQGGPFFDYLELIKNFDPKYVSLHFDTGHWLQVSQSNLASLIMWAGPYVGGFVWKDELVEKAEPVTGEAAGRGGGVNGFSVRQVPVGTGMVDFNLAARSLKLINFDGPTECQPEWTGLGGAESGRDTLTLPRETVIGLLKRDYQTIHAALTSAGLA